MGLLLLLLPALQVGRGSRGRSQRAPGVVSRGAPSPPARSRPSERGGSASGQSSGARGRAPASPSPSGAGEVGAARSQQTPPSRASASVVSPHSSPEVRLAVPDLLGRMIVRHVLGRPDHMPGMTDTGQVLVVDPLLLWVRRMTTGLVP